MIWLDYLFKLNAERESGVLLELGRLITWERAVRFAVNLSLSQQKRSVLVETQVRQESFSALCLVVLTSVIVKTIKKLKSCTVPRWHGAPDEEGKERHREIRQKLAGSPESYVCITSRESAVKQSTAGSVDLSVPIPITHKTPMLVG